MRSHRILVADNDAAWLDFGAQVISRLPGVTVATAEDGDDAIAASRSFVPHLVVMDVSLPGHDGFSVLRLLRRDRKTAHAKVIMVSSHDNERTRASAAKFGADSVLAKPYTAEALTDMAMELLGIDEAAA